MKVFIFSLFIIFSSVYAQDEETSAEELYPHRKGFFQNATNTYGNTCPFVMDRTLFDNYTDQETLEEIKTSAENLRVQLQASPDANCQALSRNIETVINSLAFLKGEETPTVPPVATDDTGQGEKPGQGESGQGESGQGEKPGQGESGQGESGQGEKPGQDDKTSQGDKTAEGGGSDSGSSNECLRDPQRCVNAFKGILDSIQNGQCTDASSLISTVSSVAMSIGATTGNPYVIAAGAGVEIINQLVTFLKQNPKALRLANQIKRSETQFLQKNIEAMNACYANNLFKNFSCIETFVKSSEQIGIKDSFLYENAVQACETVTHESDEEKNKCIEFNYNATKESQRKLLELKSQLISNSGTVINIEEDIKRAVPTAREYHLKELSKVSKDLKKTERELKSFKGSKHAELFEDELVSANQEKHAEITKLISHCYEGWLVMTSPGNDFEDAGKKPKQFDKYCKRLDSCMEKLKGAGLGDGDVPTKSLFLSKHGASTKTMNCRGAIKVSNIISNPEKLEATTNHIIDSGFISGQCNVDKVKATDQERNEAESIDR